MKKLCSLILPLLLFCIPARAQVAPVQATLNSASTGACTPTSCLALTVPSGVGSVSISIVGSSGTVVFEVVDINGNYASVNVTPSTSSTQVSTATVSGTNFYQANVAGYSTFRVRLTASGSAAVVINPSTASARASGGGGAGGGVTSLTGDGTLITNSSSTGAVTLTTDTLSGTGSVCMTTNCAMTTPNLGTPSAINLTNATATPACSTCTTNASALTSNVLVKGGGGQAAQTSSVTDNGSNVSTAEEIITTAAGAASTPALSATGLPFAGTGTTSVPLHYLNGGTAPTTWATGGTYFGINSASGFAGNFIDLRANGSGSEFKVDTGGSVTINGSFVTPNQIQINSHFFIADNGVGIGIFENNSGNGLTRIALGPDSTSSPALCPSNVATGPMLTIGIAGATCTTKSYVKTAQTLEVTASDFTCSSGCTSLSTITGLTATLPLVATNWSFSCDLIISQATAAATDQIGVQTATNAPTNLAATAFAYTAAAVSTSGSLVANSSTSSQSVLSFTPGATGTNLPLHLAGTIEGASASGTVLNIQILTGSSSDAITVRRGSACWVY